MIYTFSKVLNQILNLNSKQDDNFRPFCLILLLIINEIYYNKVNYINFLLNELGGKIYGNAFSFSK